ncbi:MAG: hypothetical protein U0744_12220 [Gemmataceae bacterium]
MRLLLALLCFALPAIAGDLTKVNRTVAKMPKLTSKEPKYFIVVVGQDPAKGKTMLGIIDDDKLYLDINGNRDLTDADETITSNGFWNAKFKLPGKDFEHVLKVRISAIALTLPDGLEQTVFFRGNRFKWGKDVASRSGGAPRRAADPPSRLESIEHFVTPRGPLHHRARHPRYR